MSSKLTRVGMTSIAVILLTSAVFGGQAKADQLQGSNRQPRWLFDTLSGYMPSTDTISNRVSETFSRSSMSETLSVLAPVRNDNPYSCRTSNDDVFQEGICIRYADCVYYDGASYGSCGSGLGSCCVFERRCSETSDSYVTHFTNPRYPLPTAGETACKLTINPLSANICQYRVDFDEFKIMGPDETSNCVGDFLAITGGSSLPKICGDMTGQHLYVNVKPGQGTIHVAIDTDVTEIVSRIWNLKITQIACDSPAKAPPGCLQFFNETTGIVKSFNFKNVHPSERHGLTRQIHNHQYGVCVNSKVGYCDLKWAAASFQQAGEDGDSTDLSFTVSGDSTADQSTSELQYGINSCRTDYVTIPGGKFESSTGEVIEEDRYCGNVFPKTVQTNSQPYRLYVTTDATEEGDRGNAGFALSFRHNLC